MYTLTRYIQTMAKSSRQHNSPRHAYHAGRAGWLRDELLSESPVLRCTRTALDRLGT